MIYADIVQARRIRDSRSHRKLGKCPETVVQLRVYIIHNHIVNTVAAPVFSYAAIRRQSIPHLKCAGHVPNLTVSDSDIRDNATRADVSLSNRLILWSQQDRKASLRKSSPGIFQNVSV